MVVLDATVVNVALPSIQRDLHMSGANLQSFSWPWIFFINVPVGVVALIVSARLVPESRDEEATRSFDVGGAVTVTGRPSRRAGRRARRSATASTAA